MLLRQGVQEESAVGLRENARVEDGNDPSIRGSSNEAPDALPEFDDRCRQRQFGEGIPSGIANGIALCFEERMRRWIEWQPCHDDLGKGAARDVDAGPETFGAEENGVSRPTHFPGEFRS